MKRVTVNADDFGLNKHCSEAIAEAFRKGLVTDTTMMATGEYFDEAAALAKEQGFSDRIGVHLNLTEGVPLTKEIKNCPRFVADGRFHKGYNRVMPLSKVEKKAVYKELTAQMDKIQKAGFQINHADSHHHIHTGVFIAPIVVKVCREHNVDKIRLHRNLGTISAAKRFVKTRYNRWLRRKGFTTTEYFAYVIDIRDGELPDNTEIMVHPDYDKDGVLIDRRGVEDGFPIGYPLPDLQAERQVTLRGYSEI